MKKRRAVVYFVNDHSPLFIDYVASEISDGMAIFFGNDSKRISVPIRQILYMKTGLAE